MNLSPQISIATYSVFCAFCGFDATIKVSLGTQWVREQWELKDTGIQRDLAHLLNSRVEVLSHLCHPGMQK